MDIEGVVFDASFDSVLSEAAVGGHPLPDVILIISVDLDLFQEVKLGHEATSRAHVFDALEDLGLRGTRFLQIELVARETENDQISAGVGLGECIQASVVRPS